MGLTRIAVLYVLLVGTRARLARHSLTPGPFLCRLSVFT